MKQVYKIVKIISDKKIVINAGRNHNVKLGDIFEVYEIGDEVMDLDTKESLGTLRTFKAYVEVVQLYDKMSVCENNEKNRIQLFEGNTIGSSKELKVELSQITGGISNDKTIRVGDCAVKQE